MKNKFLIGVFFILGAFSIFSQNKSLKINDKIPMVDEKMKTVDDSEISLSDIKKENGLLVIFSCNTCPFVIGAEDGTFRGWERDYANIKKLADEKKVGVILINSNEAKRISGGDSFEDMKERAKNKNYTIPYAVDENSVIANAFGAKTTPHIYLFNKDSKLVYTGSIDNTWDPKRKEDIPYLVNALNELNGKIKISESEPRGCGIKRLN
jgi:thioredoxin-related protein